MKKQTQQLVVMLSVGIAIGIFLVLIFNNKSTQVPTGSPSNSTSVTIDTQEKIISQNQEISQAKAQPLPPSIPLNSRVGLTVADQLHDTVVYASGLNVDIVSWVVIYDERNGHPNVILGAQKVKPGETTAIIDLLRREGTIAGMTYFAGILADDGDGVFNRLTDLPSFQREKTVMVKFNAI